MRTKTEVSRLVARGLVHETFAHETLGHFDVTRLRAVIDTARDNLVLHYCKFNEIRMVDGIEINATDYLFANREIDYAHAANMPERTLKDPLIFLLCPPGTNGKGESHLLLDGIHRLFERKRRGKEGFRFYLFPLELAPRVDNTICREVKWGNMDVIPGRGLVRRGP